MNRTKEYNRHKMFSKALRKRNISNRVYGYDFYENHWIPLYKARGLQWHETETEE